MDKIAQIETLTLRDYIDKEMTKLRDSCLRKFLENNAENPDKKTMLEIMCDNARNIALQEIAYRLEYGFIIEIGNTSLKHKLPK